MYLDVWIDIKSIKGSKGSRMDKITWKALKMDTYPRITYSLKKIKSIEKTDSGFLISANGLLSIAGTENPIELKVKVTLLPNGDILFESSKWLKMTDFNVDPPTAMFGALKTGDDISLDFKIRVSNN